MVIEKNLFSENLSLYNVYLKEEKPSWVQTFPEEKQENSSLDSQGGVKNLLVNEQYYIDGQQVTFFRKTRLQAINMDGIQECSRLLIDFNPKYHIFTIHEIAIERDGIVIDRLHSTEMQILRRETQAEYHIYSGDLTLSIILDDIKINDTLIFCSSTVIFKEYSVKFYNRLIALEYNAPIYQLHLSIIHKKTETIQYRFLTSKQKLQFSEWQDCNVLTFNKVNIPARKNDKYYPYWYWPVDFLQIGIKTTWKDIAINYAKYFNYPDIINSTLLEFIHELKNASFTEEMIVLKTLNFINNNIRYLANPTATATDSIVPADPNQTVKIAYADCKGLVFLMYTILSFFNIKSHPVLVHTTFGKNLNTILPSARLFNHVIIVAQIQNKHFFIDPTIRQEVDNLESLFLPEYGYALICAEDSESLINTEKYITCKNYVSVTEEYYILSIEKNEALFKSEIEYNGSSAIKLKQLFSDPQYKQKFGENCKIFYEKVFEKVNQITKLEINDSAIKNNRLNIIFHSKISLKRTIDAKKRYQIQIVPLDLLEPILYYFPSDHEKKPFYFGPLLTVDYKIEVYDLTFKASKAVISDKVCDDAFNFLREVESKRGVLIFKFHFEKLKDAISQKKLCVFKENHTKATNLISLLVFLKMKKKPLFSYKHIMRLGFIILWFIAMLISHHASFKTIDLQSTPQNDNTLEFNSTLKNKWIEQYLNK